MEKKDTIKRVKLEDGNFATISRDVLMDENLTDSAFRMLVWMLNNSNEWKLNVTYFKNVMGWSFNKLASAKKNLVKLGYLIVETEKGGYGKGDIHSYTVQESTSLILEVLNCKLQNRSSKLGVAKRELNDNNIEEMKKEENKLDEMNCIVIGEKMENGPSTQEVKNLTVEAKQSNPIHSVEGSSIGSIKNEFKAPGRTFEFEAYEQPTQEKIIDYVTKKGYPSIVGIEIHKSLLQRDFKNSNGEPIKGIQGYIDVALKTKQPNSINPIHSVEGSIGDEKEFVKAVSSTNEMYARNYCNINPNADYQTNLLHMQEAAKHFFNLVGRTKEGYNNYLRAFINETISSNKIAACSLFNKYVQGNNQRVIKESSNESEVESVKVVYEKKEITNVSSTGKDYFNR